MSVVATDTPRAVVPGARRSSEGRDPASFPRYPKYKDSGLTWLGEVPAHWTVAPLGAIAELIQTGPFGSQLHSEDYVEDEVPVINPSNMRGGQLVADRTCTVPPSFALRLREYALAENDIVLARRGEMGRCAVVTAQEAGWLCGTGSLTIRLGKAADPNFICLLIGTENAKALLTLESVGSTMDNLNASILAHLRVPVPPVEEQLAIATFLDRETAKIDALVEEQENLIALLKEKRQALISHAVTKGLNSDAPMKDPSIEWLGHVPAHWEIVRLKRIVVFQRGHDLPAESRENGEVPVVSSGGRIGYHAHAVAKAPGIVTGRYGSIGEFNLIEEDYWPLNTALYSIDLCGNHPRYVWYLLQSLSEHFLLNSMKSAVPGVDRNDIHEVLSVLAPLEEQEGIATFLDRSSEAIDRLSNESERAIELLKERRSVLISAAVTGKICVLGS